MSTGKEEIKLQFSEHFSDSEKENVRNALIEQFDVEISDVPITTSGKTKLLTESLEFPSEVVEVAAVWITLKTASVLLKFLVNKGIEKLFEHRGEETKFIFTIREGNKTLTIEARTAGELRKRIEALKEEGLGIVWEEE